MELVQSINQRFHGQDTIVFFGTPTDKRTGWFEVSVDGKLIYSRRQGMRRFSDEHKQAVFDEIERALEREKGLAGSPLSSSVQSSPPSPAMD